MGELNNTLSDVGSGLGAFFDTLGVPLVNFLILLSIGAGIGAILMAVAGVVGKGIRRS